MVAFHWERRLNSDQAGFRLPILWLGVAFVRCFMSLDEVTILHENLYWREVRHVSVGFGDSWKYVTQWQVLFAPAILIVLGYFAVFFSNRFSLSPRARWSAFGGIGCWLIALLLEGVRGTFRSAGGDWYLYQVLAEEGLEMAGAILLTTSVVFYTLAIALDLTPERRRRLHLASRFLARPAAAMLAVVFLVLSVFGGVIFVMAQRQAAAGAPVPRLIRKALGSRSVSDKKVPNLAAEVPDSSTVSAPSRSIWFGDMKGRVALDDAAAQKLLEGAFESLSKGKPSVGFLGSSLQSDAGPRIVFLTVGGADTAAAVAVGTGQGVRAALQDALARVPRTVSGGDRRRWIKLDVVESVGDSESVRSIAPTDFERSLQGIAFEGPPRVAFLAEELVAHDLVSSKREVRLDRMNRYIRRRSEVGSLPLDRPLTARRFSCLSFFYDGTKTISLYRGHHRRSPLSKEQLLQAARQGGAYLSRSVDPKGRFAYSYRPKTNDLARKYNMVRHAGTVFSMLDLYQTTRDENLLRASERAIDYLIGHIQPFGDRQDELSVLAYKRKIKLGGVALAVVALAKHIEVTGDNRHLALSKRLGRYIQQSQEANGKFLHQRNYPSGSPRGFVSQYYPGEAQLALVRLYTLDPDESWLDTVERNANYLINVRDRGRQTSRLIHDHWLLYALNELYRFRPKPLYLKHSMRIAQAIMGRQNRNPATPDHLGSYYRPPRSTPTATRSEGLLAAYQLARDFGRQGRAQATLEAIGLGISFQLQTQFQPESVLYLEDPERALGGFRRSLTDFEIRIDYVQHNISALVALYRLLEREGMDSLRTEKG